MFEYDPDKSKLNERKHGISFQSARRLWKDANRVEIPARWVDEERFLLLAMHENDLWAAIYTNRKGKIRIISLRKARDYEKEIYLSGRI